MPSTADHEHIIDTGKGTFSLDDLGHLMPGMAEIMPLVGARIWKCYYAGKAENRALARFQLKEAVNLMEKGDAMVSAANAYHEVYDKEFLRWKVPDQPPPDLDMTPRR
jgi:hypothetical protein